MLKAIDILGFEKVNDIEPEKVLEIASSIRENGWRGAPILTYGNTLITGSHRLAALDILAGEDFDLNFECAVDVTDIIEQNLAL